MISTENVELVLALLFFLNFLRFFESGFPCYPSWSRTLCVDQAALKLTAAFSLSSLSAAFKKLII